MAMRRTSHQASCTQCSRHPTLIRQKLIHRFTQLLCCSSVAVTCPSRSLSTMEQIRQSYKGFGRVLGQKKLFLTACDLEGTSPGPARQNLSPSCPTWSISQTRESRFPKQPSSCQHPKVKPVFACLATLQRPCGFISQKRGEMR